MSGKKAVMGTPKNWAKFSRSVERPRPAGAEQILDNTNTKVWFGSTD